MTAAVDQLDGEGPDRVGAEPSTLGVGPQEQVDAGLTEVGFELFDRLDVADDPAVMLDDVWVLLGAAADQVGAHALEIEVTPPATDLGLGQDRRQGGRPRPSSIAG